MLNSIRQNYHHSKLPKLGEIVVNPFTQTKCIVIAFPLCDNVSRYCFGIHTCLIRQLKDNKTMRIAGHWLFNEN